MNTKTKPEAEANLNTNAGNPEWADKVKSLKAGFFPTKESAVVHHERLYSENGILRVKNEIEAGHVVSYSSGKVLDVGTGTGRFARPLYDAGLEVTGVDISESMLAVAKETSGDRKITWQVADVENLPFEAASFDTITSINVITHLPQWQSCIKEFKRVCKPGGRIIFDSCSGDILDIVNRKQIKYGAKSKNDDSHFFAENRLVDMCSFLENAGLTIEAIIPHNLFNSNYLIQDQLGSKYSKFEDFLKEKLLNDKAAFDLWCQIERKIIRHIPTDLVYDYIVITNNSAEGKKQVPAPLSTYAKPIKIESFLKQCLGADYASTISGIDKLLTNDGAYELMEVLEKELLNKVEPGFKLEQLFPQAAIQAKKHGGLVQQIKKFFAG